MKKIVLLTVLLFSAISYTAVAQQYYSKPFVTQLEDGLKMLKGNPNTPKDTVMTGKKLAEVYKLSKALLDGITEQMFNTIFPAQIDSFKMSQGQASPYRGLGMGAVRNYNHSANLQQLSIEVSTDTSQFYSIRYYMNNSQTIAKNNPDITITAVKLDDKYEGFVYKTKGYSFCQVMLDNAYVKFTTMEIKKDDKIISSYNADAYKKLAKKFDMAKVNKATTLK